MFKLALRYGLLGAVLLFIVGVGAGVAVHEIVSVPRFDKQSDGLYAVQMTSGQIYFGHIEGQNEDSIHLTDVFYFPATDSTLGNSADMTLVKLGSEIYAPEDWMDINRSNVISLQKLKDDGKVGKAINEYRQK